MTKVVTDKNATGKGKICVGPRGAAGTPRQALEASHVVVSDEADGPPKKVRQIAGLVRTVARENCAQYAQGTDGGVNLAVEAGRHSAITFGGDAPATIESNEGVPSGRLAEVGTLEQEDRPLGVETLIERHGRLAV